MPLAPSVQTMMFAVGLRGAVAYGLVLNLPASGSDTGNGIPAVESATLVIVLATTLVFGGATGRYHQLLWGHGRLHCRGPARSSSRSVCCRSVVGFIHCIV